MFKLEDLDFDFQQIKTTPEIEKSFNEFSETLAKKTGKSIVRNEKVFQYTDGYNDWPLLKKIAYHENQIAEYNKNEKELTGKFLSLNTASKKVHTEALNKLYAKAKA